MNENTAINVAVDITNGIRKENEKKLRQNN